MCRSGDPRRAIRYLTQACESAPDGNEEPYVLRCVDLIYLSSVSHIYASTFFPSNFGTFFHKPNAGGLFHIFVLLPPLQIVVQTCFVLDRHTSSKLHVEKNCLPNCLVNQQLTA